ncbi:MAG TPA: PilZ domain-containing protein [Terriglobales bacterium]|nr:PilZ domain-containing protein [Terriglobales bacterium]
MGLDCLVVTCDPTLLGQIKANFSARGVSLDLRQDSVSAVELASRRHWDGLIIDCDDVAGGMEALVNVRSSRSNRETLIVAVLNGSTNRETALDLGANFVLCKPIEESRLLGVLDIALPKMEREHRRYFRYDIDLPVRFQNHLGQSFSTTMNNVSEGGMAIRLVDPVHLKGVVPVDFDIPSVEPQAFHAKADIVWSDSFAMGLRFLHIEKDCEVALQSWLSSLEAQLQFRGSTERIG